MIVVTIVWGGTKNDRITSNNKAQETRNLGKNQDYPKIWTIENNLNNEESVGVFSFT